MKIYVAGRFTEKEMAKVREVMRKLREMGHEITVDWTKHIPIHKDGYSKHLQLAEQYAIEDIKGVIESDVFILLTTDDIGTGMHVELGAAIASFKLRRKPTIYVVGKHIDKCLFYYHPSVKRRNTIEEVLQEISYTT